MAFFELSSVIQIKKKSTDYDILQQPTTTKIYGVFSVINGKHINVSQR